MAGPVYCITDDVKAMLGTSSLASDMTDGIFDDILSDFISFAAIEVRGYIRPRFDPSLIASAPSSPDMVREFNALLTAERFLRRQGNMDAGRDAIIIDQLGNDIEHIRSQIQRGQLEDENGDLFASVIGVAGLQTTESTVLEDAWE